MDQMSLFNIKKKILVVVNQQKMISHLLQL